MGLKRNLRSKHPEILVRRLKSQFRFKFCGLDPSLFHISWNKRLGLFHFLLEKGGFLTGSLKKRFSFSCICREPNICWFPSCRWKGTIFILYIEAKKPFFLLFWGGKNNSECNSIEKMKTIYGKIFLERGWRRWWRKPVEYKDCLIPSYCSWQRSSLNYIHSVESPPMFWVIHMYLMK